MDTKKPLTKFIDADDLLHSWYGRDPRGGDYLAGLRYREGMTQEELSSAIGVAQSNISAMESGDRPIGKKLAKELGAFFSCDWIRFLR
jgi:transcriptional regulator with XRE-family HTH domain